MRPYGERAVLVDTDRPLALAAAVRGRAGVVDVVPGASSVLVVVAEPGGWRDLPLDELAELPAAEPETVVVPVRYDGADLAEIATAAGLSVEEVVARHAGGDYRVALVGFVPGFGYLSGLDPRLHLPRRATPRTSVPAGSVALAGGWTGVYPRSTPGGWHLLGRTDLPLWDLSRDPPALLRPGMRVRFEPVP